MERDKAVARLGLGLVEELPRELLVDTVQVGRREQRRDKLARLGRLGCWLVKGGAG
jgi:hypothetical protein